MKSIQVVLLLFLFLYLTAAQAFSQDVSLSWDPSPSSSVTGYKIYYKDGDRIPPFDGVAAENGISPVDVGDTLEATLSGLLDGETYYFAVTAYDADGNESAYSNIVSNGWVPELIAPAENAEAEPFPVMFDWEDAPNDMQVTYTLYYGTDRDQVASAGQTGIPAPTGRMHPPESGALLIVLASLGTVLLFSRASTARRPARRLLPVLLVLGGLLTACGGSGGGSPVTGDRALDTGDDSSPVAVEDFQSVDTGIDNFYDAYEVMPNTTYYWKVVATDSEDALQVYESAVGQFTTGDF